jgi:hypothetical protein
MYIEIQNEKISINQIIQSLGNYITNTDERIRSKGKRDEIISKQG